MGADEASAVLDHARAVVDAEHALLLESRLERRAARRSTPPAAAVEVDGLTDGGEAVFSAGGAGGAAAPAAPAAPAAAAACPVKLGPRGAGGRGARDPLRSG